MKMGHSKIGIGSLLFSAAICMGCRDGRNVLKFEPDHISTASVEYSSTFSPTGEELYFARSDQEWGSAGMKSTIYRAVKRNGKWSTPKIVSFSGEFEDSDPHLSGDGKTLYFISNRPGADPTVPVSADIWMAKREPNGAWGTPTALPYPLNSEHTEYSPRTDGRGNLYFASDRPGGLGQGDLYVSPFKNGKLGAPLNMGHTLNSATGEWNLGINDKGDLLIFEASQRKENVSSYGDLYISFKEGDHWTVPQNMVELNTSGSDLYPYLTHDGKHLYFTSSDSLKGKSANIYVVDFEGLYRRYKQRSKTP